MPLKIVAVLIAVAAIAITAWGIWNERRHPSEVTARGVVRVKSRIDASREADLPTRDVRIGNVQRREVLLPGGTWIDCAGDCAEAARKALPPDFWEAMREKGR